MKKYIQLFLCSLLVLSMSACQVSTTNQPTEEASTVQKEDFTQFLDDLVVDFLSSDFTSMQQFVENPSDFGINRDEVEVSLGHIVTPQEDIQDTKDALETLHTFDYDSLSRTEQIIYKSIEANLELSVQMADSRFDYTGQIWQSLSGIHRNLITFFSEYTIKDKRDLDDLITLINDVPRYVDEALDYTNQQVEHDSLCFDYDEVLANIQDTIDSKDKSSILTEIYDEIDHFELSKEETKDYKEKVKEALDKNFFPSYEKMKETLTSLKSKVKPLTGLYNIKNGKEYYEYLVQNSTGSTESISTIQKNLNEAIEDAKDELYSILSSNPLATTEVDFISTGYDDINEILPSLKKAIAKDFPKVQKLDYELNALNDDQSTSGIVAYCMVPALDSTAPTQIRYNKRDYGNEPDSLMLYTTLAHEGIPGHMYQLAYVLENMEHPIQYLLTNNGYTEGYATYVQFSVLEYLDTSDAIRFYKYNEILTYMYICLMDIDINYEGLSKKDFSQKYSALFGTDVSNIYNQLADNPTSFLSYYYGFYQIMKLRAYAKNELGSKFTNLGFNEAILRYGSLPFDLVQQSVDDYIKETK